MISYHIIKGTLDHLDEIKHFVDYWLSGRGIKDNAPGATNDVFISPRQHKKYIEKYKVSLLYDKSKLIGWAVVQTNETLIHFLISGFYRRQNIGSRFLKKINPPIIRSKSDQSSGNPRAFYEKNGYHFVTSTASKPSLAPSSLKLNRPKNINILVRKHQPC